MSVSLRIHIHISWCFTHWNWLNFHHSESTVYESFFTLYFILSFIALVFKEICWFLEKNSNEIILESVIMHCLCKLKMYIFQNKYLGKISKFLLWHHIPVNICNKFLTEYRPQFEGKDCEHYFSRIIKNTTGINFVQDYTHVAIIFYWHLLRSLIVSHLKKYKKFFLATITGLLCDWKFFCWHFGKPFNFMEGLLKSHAKFVHAKFWLTHFPGDNHANKCEHEKKKKSSHDRTIDTFPKRLNVTFRGINILVIASRLTMSPGALGPF